MFEKGQSGNSNGRPVGALNKRTQALRLLIDGEAEGLVRKAVDKAKEGDIQALRLVLERILPPMKDAPINIKLPRVGKKASSVLNFSREVIKAVTDGEITPSEGETLIGIIEKYGKAIDLKELEVRILALEQSIEKKGNFR
jgi:hypothetical protein